LIKAPNRITITTPQISRVIQTLNLEGGFGSPVWQQLFIS